MDKLLFRELEIIVEKHGEMIFGRNRKIRKIIKPLFLYQLKNDPKGFIHWPSYFIFFLLHNHWKKYRLPFFHYMLAKIRKFLYAFFTSKLTENEKKVIRRIDFILKDAALTYPFLHLFYDLVIKDQYHAKEFIKNSSNVIDCGANIGVFFSLCILLR